MAYNFSDLSVLVVEDSKPMLELTVSILETFGIGNIVTAENGKDGFQRFCTYNPDLVIADWMMEPVNGIELARHIRTHSRSPNKYVPFILMTGFSEKHRVIKARDIGITEFLVKPFTVRDLYKRLELIIERPRQFVRSGDFFGPDRRRRKGSPNDGQLKRETDVVEDDYAYINVPDPKAR